MNYKKGIPLYVQIKEKLLQDIEKNYKAGDKIDNEEKLEKKYKVSRITIRRAIEELEKENIVEKMQGRGTFVKEPKILYDANVIGSLTQRLEKENIALKTVLLNYIIIEDDHSVKNLLKCKKLLCIERVRVIGDKTFAYMLNYINYDIVHGLREEFTIESLYTFYKQRYGIEFFNAEETIEAKYSSKKISKLLKIEDKSPILCLQRLSFDRNNLPIEYSDIAIKHDMYKHKIILKNEILSNM